MFEFLQGPSKEARARDLAAEADRIATLIEGLLGGEAATRDAARRALIVTGGAAVPALADLLASPDEAARREAAIVLSSCATPDAAPALVAALEDQNSGIRWLAAKGLIAAGRGGLEPLLRELINRSESVWLRDGAHHVLRALVRRSADDPVGAVLGALEGPEPDLTVPPAAMGALRALPAD